MALSPVNKDSHLSLVFAAFKQIYRVLGKVHHRMAAQLAPAAGMPCFMPTILFLALFGLLFLVASC